MEVRVASLGTAVSRAEGWATKVVSLIQTQLVASLPKFEQPHLVLVFSDEENAISPNRPKQEYIQKVFAFVGAEDKAVVHCEGGISRSVAMAIGLLLRAGKSVEEAVIEVHRWSPNMWPNRLMLGLIGTELGIEDLPEKVSKARQVFGTDIWLWCSDCGKFFPDKEGAGCQHFSTGEEK